MNAWNVFRVVVTHREGSTLYERYLVDTVYFDKGCDWQYVKRSLVGHDGYPSDIFVQRKYR